MLALAIAFLSASQDIAIDAYRTDILLPDERGLGAAAYIFLSYGDVDFRRFGTGSCRSCWLAHDLRNHGCLNGICILITFSPRISNGISAPKTFADAVLKAIINLFTRKRSDTHPVVYFVL